MKAGPAQVWPRCGTCGCYGPPARHLHLAARAVGWGLALAGATAGWLLLWGLYAWGQARNQ